MATADTTLGLTAPTTRLSQLDKAGLAVFGTGLLALVVAAFGAGSALPEVSATLSLGLMSTGGLIYFWGRHARRPAGIQNDGLRVSGVLARGALGWILGVVLTGFYVLLYWFPETLEHLVRMTDPMSYLLRGVKSDQWFLYGTFYTLAVLVMGIRALLKFRHSRYQVIRTISVMFFQLGFAYVLPGVLVLLNQPEFYFHYFWPLKYDYLWPSGVNWVVGSTSVGIFFIFWGGVMTFVATPILTYFFGKRWYCSWVCGCGALAETLGDPWRQLSDKSLQAWKIERWMIHGILLAVALGTLLLWVNSAMEGGLLRGASRGFSRWYGFFIGSVFAGVIGVGFYPLMGSRVWCRFGCPMAAVLGILQKYLSRFRITTNGGQCISCGNCSTYCEMGIDVRWYAQRGQNIIRASCVGCGVCSSVCPRGVLKLENGPHDGRYNTPSLVIDPASLDVLPDSWPDRHDHARG